MKLIIYMSFMVLLVCPCLAVQADEINYKAMEQEGFGNVAELLKSMTPEQREAILKQAEGERKKLENLSPEEQKKLHLQLRDVANTLAAEQIDPAKLSSHSKDAHDVQKDLDMYQQQYREGTIK